MPASFRPRPAARNRANDPALPPSARPTENASLAVPAYFGPWEAAEWNALIARRPAVVVINPENGPGLSCHGGYREIVDRCATIGAEVLGYLSTRWLERSTVDIADDVVRFRHWYGVSRIFFDEIPNRPGAGRVAMLAALDDLTPAGHTVFNCGQPVPRRWFDALPDVRWGTFEGGPGQLIEASFAGPPHRQMHFVHSVTDRDVPAVNEELRRRGVGYACVTADTLPNPWDVCPRR